MKMKKTYLLYCILDNSKGNAFKNVKNFIILTGENKFLVTIFPLKIKKGSPKRKALELRLEG
jgi:hypothetical protein